MTFNISSNLLACLGIDHCGFDILVTEKFLNGADIIACFKQVSCKAMAEAMWADIFINSCFDGRLANGFLQNTLVPVMTFHFSIVWIR